MVRPISFLDWIDTYKVFKQLDKENAERAKKPADVGSQRQTPAGGAKYDEGAAAPVVAYHVEDHEVTKDGEVIAVPVVAQDVEDEGVGKDDELTAVPVIAHDVDVNGVAENGSSGFNTRAGALIAHDMEDGVVTK